MWAMKIGFLLNGVTGNLYIMYLCVSTVPYTRFMAINSNFSYKIKAIDQMRMENLVNSLFLIVHSMIIHAQINHNILCDGETCNLCSIDIKKCHNKVAIKCNGKFFIRYWSLQVT